MPLPDSRTRPMASQSPRAAVRTAAGLLCLVAVAAATGSARATTSNYRGIVVSAGEERGTPVANIRITWGAARYGEDQILKAPVRADACVFLDGKPSTFAEAFKPGYLVKCLLDISYFACYSKNFHFADIPGSLGPGDGFYTLHLAGAVQNVLYVAGGKDKAGEERPYQGPLTVYVACRGEKVVGAAAATPAFNGNWLQIPHLPVDSSGLAVAGGCLRGTLRLDLLSDQAKFPAKGKGHVACRYEVDLPLGQAKARGTFKGACGPKEVQGAVEVEGAALPALGKDRTVWIRLLAPTGLDEAKTKHDEWSLTFRLRGQEFVPGIMSIGYKCHPSGKVPGGKISFDGDRVEGQLDAALEYGGSATVRFSGIVLGEHLFGACEVRKGQAEPIHGTFRGAVLEFDAPRVCGWDEGAAKKRQADLKAGKPLPDDLDK